MVGDRTTLRETKELLKEIAKIRTELVNIRRETEKLQKLTAELRWLDEEGRARGIDGRAKAAAEKETMEPNDLSQGEDLDSRRCGVVAVVRLTVKEVGVAEVFDRVRIDSCL